jgi:FlgN protein
VEKLTWVLWRERELLEGLLYRLETEEMVMSSGRTRWLVAASRDVEEAARRVREVELLRAVAADEAAAGAGLEPNPSLSALIAAAEEPWTSILAEHREAFTVLSEEIIRAAATNRGLISAGLRAAHETLLDLGAKATTYTADGAVLVGSTRTAGLDRSL